jgi:hypothetical protein
MARIDRKKDTYFATLTVEKQKDGAKRKFNFIAHEVRLGTYDWYGDEQTSLCATEASPDEKAEGDEMTRIADRVSIAKAMTADDMTLGEVAALVRAAMCVQDKQARNRIVAAIPEEWTPIRNSAGLFDLKRVKISEKVSRIERRPAA